MKVLHPFLNKYRCFSFKYLFEIRVGYCFFVLFGILFLFFASFYSCQSNILFVSTSNSFCNKGFQNLLSFFWGSNKEWNKQGRWLYVLLSFQILVPSCYELHARVLFLIQTKWKKHLYPIKSKFTFGVNVEEHWFHLWRKYNMPWKYSDLKFSKHLAPRNINFTSRI